jgi:uncharacterized protein (DUF924 family)
MSVPTATRNDEQVDSEARMPSDPADILTFWRAAGPDKWFEKNDAFDGEIRERFRDTYAAGAAGRLAAWEEDAEGALALVIVLDQFPRNMFRGDARTYAADPLARAVAQRAIARGFDQAYVPPERRFFYLPFTHSENLADQERCVALNRAAADEEGTKWAELHADIIRRFGRFPHRNSSLGRATTAEEQAFLDGGGFAG